MKFIIASCCLLLTSLFNLAAAEQKYLQSEDGRIELMGQGPWVYPATRYGQYDVLIDVEGNSDLAAEVRVGSKVVSTTLKQASSKADREPQYLGSVRIDAEGDVEISADLTDTKSNHTVRLRKLILVPACEGERPVQTNPTELILHARDAIILGTILRYEPKPEKNTLGYWIKSTDKAAWEFTMEKPGWYEIEVLQGCGEGQGGSDAVVRIGDQEIPFVVEETGHFQKFVPRVIGRIQIAEAGDYRLEIQPTKIKVKAAMDVRQVRLVGVEA